jgi:hypothetical protein
VNFTFGKGDASRILKAYYPTAQISSPIEVLLLLRTCCMIYTFNLFDTTLKFCVITWFIINAL